MKRVFIKTPSHIRQAGLCWSRGVFPVIFTLFNWKIAIQAVENRSNGRVDLSIDHSF
jgi:hypothetical protein